MINKYISKMIGQVHVKQVLASVFLSIPGVENSSSEDFPSCNLLPMHNYILGAPPLGLVQVLKIIFPHQIIVQK